jgi:hypothetical protein
MQSHCLRGWGYPRLLGVTGHRWLVPWSIKITITNAPCITSLKPGLIAYRGPLNYSRNIATFQTCPLTKIFCALTDELAHETATANKTPTGRRLIKLLQSKITEILEPTPVPPAQKTQGQEQRVRELQQLELDEAPILTIPRILNAPPIMKARNPTAKLVLKNTPHLHRLQTRNNTPGAVPAIQRIDVIDQNTRHCSVVRQKRIDKQDDRHGVRRRSQGIKEITPQTPYIPIPRGARQRVVTRQAINVLSIQKEATANTTYTPRCLMKTSNKPYQSCLNTSCVPWCIQLRASRSQVRKN